MKKSIFFLMASATFVLASCSSDEGPAPTTNSREICFRTSIGNGADTRGFETTTGSFDDFKVTAIFQGNYYFTGEVFKKGDNGLYTTATPYLWPGTDNVRFIAYSCNNGQTDGKNNAVDYAVLGTPSFTTAEKVLRDFTPNTVVKSQIDLVWADVTAKWNDDIKTNGLNLPFNHCLSQIELQAKTTNNLYTVKIAGIKAGNIKSTGTFNFDGTLADNNFWALGTTLADYVVEYESEVITLLTLRLRKRSTSPIPPGTAT